MPLKHIEKSGLEETSGGPTVKVKTRAIFKQIAQGLGQTSYELSPRMASPQWCWEFGGFTEYFSMLLQSLAVLFGFQKPGMLQSVQG